MTQKTIIIGLVALAFVVGSIMTGTMAEAKKEDKPDPVAAAIDRLTAVLQNTATQGPQGDQGIQGEQGPAGPAGSVNIYSVVEDTGQVSMINQIVQCDSGDIAIASGFGTSSNGNTRGNSPADVSGVEISDGEIPTGWRFISDSTNGDPLGGTLYVICLDNSPFRGPGPIIVIP